MNVQTDLFLIIAISFLSTVCSGQIPRPSSFDIFAGIGKSFRNLEFDDSDSTLTLINSSREQESALTSWRLGFNQYYTVNSSWYIQTGIRFSTSGIQRKYPKGLITRADLIDFIDLGNQSPISFENAYWKQTDFFFDFPINLGYQINLNKFKPFGKIGLNVRSYLGTQTNFNSTNYNSSEWIRYNFNQIQWAVNVSIGLVFELNTDYSLFCQVDYLQNITSLRDAPISEYPFSTMLEFGFRKKLQKSTL